MMHLAELETAVRYDMPLLVTVLNDQALGSEYHKMKAHDRQADLATIPTPDLGAVARSFGGRGCLATNVEDVRAGGRGLAGQQRRDGHRRAHLAQRHHRAVSPAALRARRLSSSVITLRSVEPADYARLAAIDAAIDPGDTRDPEWYRERDANWSPRLLRHRLVAERGGLVVAWGELAHGWWAYHPRKFHLRLNVEPRFQRQGVGSRMYSALVEHVVSSWNPLQISAIASEVRPWSIAFLEHREFREVQRRWDASLPVAHARLERLSAATGDMAAQNVRIVSLADLRGQHGNGDGFDHDLYVFEQRLYRDEPGYDPEGSLQFDQFMTFELNPKTAVDDGSFLALVGERMVGVSRLRLDRRGPGILHVGFTGVDPEYRGRGIAVALKLRTLEYARQHGFAEIRTENDSTNAAMLHINLELGFKLEPASIVFHKH